jgi:hypothetical protein
MFLSEGNEPMLRRARKPLVLGVLAACLTLLSGCFKLDIELTIHGDDTVTGTMVFAYDKRLAELTNQSEDSLVQSLTDNDRLDAPAGARTELYSDDTYVGIRVVFDRVAIADNNRVATDPDDLRIAHTGDRYTVSGVMDLTELDLTNPALQEVAQTFQMRIAITMPGRVISHNGELDGRTVTWRPQPGERTELRAESEEPSRFFGLQSQGSELAAIGAAGGLLVVLVVAGLVFWLLRRGRRAPPAPPVATPEAAASPQPAMWPPDA